MKREFDAAVYRAKELHDQLAWVAWHAAIIPKMKRVPRLKDLMTPSSNARKVSSWESDYAKMSAWANRSKKVH